MLRASRFFQCVIIKNPVKKEGRKGESELTQDRVGPQWAFTAKMGPVQDILRTRFESAPFQGMNRIKVLVRMEGEMVRNGAGLAAGDGGHGFRP
jgi:hypothetical protein